MTQPDVNHPKSDESEFERWQRNFNELLQELRVAQTGVQILFAFLLTLAFTNRFEGINTFERVVYLVALLSSAAAAAMIIAPVAHHRLVFRTRQKPDVVRYAHQMALGGLGFLLVAMVSSVLLVTDMLFGRTLAVVLSTATGLWFILVWALLPLFRRRGTGGAARNGS